MRYLDVNKKWISYLESLDLDTNTENYFILQSKCIYNLSKESKLDGFLMLLSETIKLKKNLDSGDYLYGNSYLDFRKAKENLFTKYNFYYDSDKKEDVDKKVKKENSKKIEVKNIKLKEEGLTKVKLNNSNVYVYKKFYNSDPISKNLEKCKKKTNSLAIDWKNIEKDLLCEVLMPILNSMIIFNEIEFWELKNINIYKRYLAKESFDKHFSNWSEFESYIGFERVSSCNFDIKFKNKTIMVNGDFKNIESKNAIKKMHIDRGTNWITEPKSFIGYAAIPILNNLESTTLSEERFIIEFNHYYKFTEAELKRLSVKEQLSVIKNRSKLNNRDIDNKFGNWQSFLKFIDKGYEL